MNIDSLLKIGLTHNESLVYLTLLKIGTSKTGEILRGANLNSGKIYEILDSLKSKGLVSESVINRIKHFTAAPPSRLLDFIQKRKDEMNLLNDLIKLEIPNLENLRNKKMKEVKSFVYLGFDGLKTAVREALDSMENGEEILGMGITGKKENKLNEFWIKFGVERAKRGIKAKNIFSDKSNYLSSYQKIKLTQNRFLEGITPVTVDIFGKDKVLIINYNAPLSCILIYDENTAEAFRTFFYQLWSIAK